MKNTNLLNTNDFYCNKEILSYKYTLFTNSSKGLEAETVVIPEIDTFHSVKDRQLLYVGFTRTLKNLILTASRETDLVKSLANSSADKPLDFYLVR